MGPGTHTATRIFNGVKPINDTDAAAMIHDVNYALAMGKPDLLLSADQKALNRARGPGYIPMYLGLKSRKILGLFEGNRNIQDFKTGALLKEQLIHNPYWKQYHIVNDDFII
jgi:hypothetical protein